MVPPAHDQELAMAARHQQHQIRVLGPVGQSRGQRMAGQMIDPDQRQSGGRRQTLGAHHPRQHPADQPWPGGNRHRIQLRQPQPGPVQRLRRADVDLFGMGAGGKFRDHAAECRVQVGLAEHHR
jgi:hypothetical protein